MGRRRDERDARDGVARLGDNLVDLESRQLSALSGLRTLGHLDLYLFGIYQVFGCHAETSAGYLLGLTAQADAIHLRVVAGVILTTLTGVRACAQLVHSQCQCLVGLDAQGTERHSTCNKVLHDALNRLHLSLTPSTILSGEGSRCLLKSKEVAEENGRFFFIYQSCPLLKELIVPCTACYLQFCNCLRVPCMLDTILSP